MASVQDIRELVSSYVSGAILASDLANRFTPVLKAAIKSQDAAVKEFALAVHAQVSHYFNGLISEDQLRSNLGVFSEAHPRAVLSFSFDIVQTFTPEPESSNPDRRSVVYPELQFMHA